VLLFATELTTLSYRSIGIGGCESRVDPGICETAGGDAHNYALWLLALLVLVFSLGAALGRSRPAALGVAAAGVVVLLVALGFDQPDLGDRRGLETTYTQVRAHTGTAFYLELVGGVLAVAAGLAALTRRPPEPEPDSVEERVAARAARRRGGR
jgi:hypothetical protein